MDLFFEEVDATVFKIILKFGDALAYSETIYLIPVDCTFLT